MCSIATLNAKIMKVLADKIHNEQMCFSITALPIDGIYRVLGAACPWDGTCSGDGSCPGTSQISSIFLLIL